MNWHTQVADLMTRNPVRVEVDAAPSEVRDLLARHAFHHLPVVRGGVLVGIVSATDLARVSLAAWVDDAATEAATIDATFSLADIMTWEPDFVRVHDPIKLAADRLSSGEYHALPVMDDADRLVGIVTSTDILRWVVRA